MEPELYSSHAQLEDDHWWFRARREIISAVLQRFTAIEDANLTEIGCGTGGNLKFFSQLCRTVTGVDTSSHAVQYARSRVESVRIISGDFADGLRSEWENIDIILLADVIEHVDNDHAFLHSIIQSMQPGSFLLVTAPAGPGLWGPHDVAFGHKRRYTEKTFRGLWADQPVDELFVSPFNCLLYPLIFMNRKLSRDNEEVQSDLHEHHWLSNTLFYWIFVAEKYWLRSYPLPWGCSLMCLLKKK